MSRHKVVFDKIFSIKNNKKHKVLTILGIKIKLRRNKEFYFNQEQILPIEKIKNEAVTICFSSNNNFFEYLYVCIYSLIKNSNKNQFYDIVVLENNITNSNKTLLKKLETNYVSIRFYNTSYIVENSEINYTINLHFSVETYFRLFIPLIFKDYSKILYMDCDGIVLDDVSQIYYENLGENFIGAVKDEGVLNQLLSQKDIDYFTKKLKLKNLFNYINTGVMVMDIEKILNFDFSTKALYFLHNFTPLYVDQCIINKVLEGKCKFFPARYNASFIYEMWSENGIRKDYLTPELKQEFQEGRKAPVFVHYLTALKPWKNPEVPMADVFWEYAKEAGMYERILYKNLR